MLVSGMHSNWKGHSVKLALIISRALNLATIFFYFCGIILYYYNLVGSVNIMKGLINIFKPPPTFL